MHYFFYGEDNFLIRNKIRAIRSQFLKKASSDLDLIELSGDSVTREALERTLLSVPIFSEKRLVILRNFLSENKDKELETYFVKLISKMAENVVLVIVEFGMPDQRKSIFKKLNQPRVAQRLSRLEGSDLRKWISGKFVELETEPDGQITTRLIESVGSDLNRLDNEIEKICLYQKATEKKISEKEFDYLVEPENSPDIFNFCEFLAHKNSKQALKTLESLIKSGENELKIFSMIAYQFRVVLSIADLIQKNTKESEIAKESGLHPFVVRKNYSLSKKFSLSDLKQIFKSLHIVDFELKSGKIDSKLQLEMLTFKLCAV